MKTLLIVPVLAALAVAAWYNWLRFGSPLTTGYLPEERFATPFFEGFYGLLLSPGKGLFWYNPLLFAAVAAWPAFYRRFRAEALLAAAVVLAAPQLQVRFSATSWPPPETDSDALGHTGQSLTQRSVPGQSARHGPVMQWQSKSRTAQACLPQLPQRLRTMECQFRLSAKMV